jgi:hypothetical protein
MRKLASASIIILLPLILLLSGVVDANPIFLPSIGLTTPSYSNPMQEFRSNNFTIRFEVQRIQNSISGTAISYKLDGNISGSIPNTSLKEVMQAQTLGGVYYIFDGSKELTNVANGVHNITIYLKTPEGNDSDSVLFSVNMPNLSPTSSIKPTQSPQANSMGSNNQAILIAIASIIVTVASLSLLYFKRDRMKKGISILIIAIILITQVFTAIYFYSLINEKDSKISVLESQITDLNNQIANPKANIVTSLGITDVPPNPTQFDNLEANYSHLWLTGWLLNSGAGIALNVKVIVLAYDNQDTLLFNGTVPVSSSGLVMFPATLPSNGAHIPYTSNTNIYSQQNMTVRFGVYHSGFFPSTTTRYEVIPICDNM